MVSQDKREVLGILDPLDKSEQLVLLELRV